MNQFAAQARLHPAALGEEVHQAQEGEGDGEGNDGGEDGVHCDLYVDLYAGFAVRDRALSQVKGCIIQQTE